MCEAWVGVQRCMSTHFRSPVGVCYWGSHSWRDDKRQKGAKTESWDKHETGVTKGGKGKTLDSKKLSRNRNTQESELFSLNQLTYFPSFAPLLLFQSLSPSLILFYPLPFIMLHASLWLILWIYKNAKHIFLSMDQYSNFAHWTSCKMLFLFWSINPKMSIFGLVPCGKGQPSID